MNHLSNMGRASYERDREDGTRGIRCEKQHVEPELRVNFDQSGWFLEQTNQFYFIVDWINCCHSMESGGSVLWLSWSSIQFHPEAFWSVPVGNQKWTETNWCCQIGMAMPGLWVWLCMPVMKCEHINWRYVFFLMSNFKKLHFVGKLISEFLFLLDTRTTRPSIPKRRVKNQLSYSVARLFWRTTKKKKCLLLDLHWFETVPSILVWWRQKDLPNRTEWVVERTLHRAHKCCLASLEASWQCSFFRAVKSYWFGCLLSHNHQTVKWSVNLPAGGKKKNMEPASVPATLAFICASLSEVPWVTQDPHVSKRSVLN